MVEGDIRDGLLGDRLRPLLGKFFFLKKLLSLKQPST